MSWIVEFLDEDVEALLDALPQDMRAHFVRIVSLIQSEGLERVREPYVKHLEAKLWEMRLKDRSGIAVPSMSPQSASASLSSTSSPRRPRRRPAVKSKSPSNGPRRSNEAQVHPRRRSPRPLEKRP